MKYYPVTSVSKAELRQREKVLTRVHYDQLTKPFMADYSDYVCGALSVAANKDNRLCLSMPQILNTAAACSLNAPKLDLYIFQSIPLTGCDGSAHIVVIQDKSSKAYIVMHGEAMKRYLERMPGYCLPYKKNPAEEVSDIIAQWTAFANEIKAPFGPDLRGKHREISAAFRTHIQPLGKRVDEVVKRFLHRTYGKRIGWGKDFSPRGIK